MMAFLKRLFFINLLVMLLAACAPLKTPASIPIGMQIENPYPPQPGDETLVRDTVEIVKNEKRK
jgi:hypothetical protein